MRLKAQAEWQRVKHVRANPRMVNKAMTRIVKIMTMVNMKPACGRGRELEVRDAPLTEFALH